jgi:hypothetical protein
LQNGVPAIGLVDHKPLIYGSLIAVRGKASTPLNTIIMFVPQQEVNMDICIFWVAISVTNNNNKLPCDEGNVSCFLYPPK